jgi:hypothetical protein
MVTLLSVRVNWPAADSAAQLHDLYSDIHTDVNWLYRGLMPVFLMILAESKGVWGAANDGRKIQSSYFCTVFSVQTGVQLSSRRRGVTASYRERRMGGGAVPQIRR